MDTMDIGFKIVRDSYRNGVTIKNVKRRKNKSVVYFIIGKPNQETSGREQG
jgi:uncharacterized protein YegL